MDYRDSSQLIKEINMSASHEDVAASVAMITRLCQQYDVAFSGAIPEILDTTNKHMLIKCATPAQAKNLGFKINDCGLAVRIRKGLKTSAYYLQVIL